MGSLGKWRAVGKSAFVRTGTSPCHKTGTTYDLYKLWTSISGDASHSLTNPENRISRYCTDFSNHSQREKSCKSLSSYTRSHAYRTTQVRHQKLERKDTFNRPLFSRHPRQRVSLLALLPQATVLRLQHLLHAAQMPLSVLRSYTIRFASVVQKFNREELLWRGEGEQLALTNGCLPWKTARVCSHASKLQAAKASHRERAWQGKQLHRPWSHQEKCKQEPEKMFCYLKGNCYTVLDKVYCTDSWNQE